MEVFDNTEENSRIAPRTALDSITCNGIMPMLYRARRKAARGQTFTFSDMPTLAPKYSGYSPLGERNFVPRRSLVFALISAARRYFWINVLLRVVLIAMASYEPFLMKDFVSFLEVGETPGRDLWYGLRQALLVVAFGTINGYLSEYAGKVQTLAQKRASSVLCTNVVDKAMRLSHTQLERVGTGKILHLLAIQRRLSTLFDLINTLWTGPLHATISLILLLRESQSSLTLGLSLIFAIVSFGTSWAINRKFRACNEMVDRHEANSAKLLSEHTRGIKAIKLNAWEPFVLKKCEYEYKEAKRCDIYWRLLTEINIGQKEVLSKGIVVGAVLSALWNEGVLTVAKVYTILSLYDKLKQPLFSFGEKCSEFASMWVYVREFEEFLGLPEMSADHGSEKIKGRELERGEIRFVGAEIRCLEKNSGSSKDGIMMRAVLKEISLNVKPGELVGVVGPVGGGKSMLLRGILGEACVSSGTILKCGDAVYLPHDPWIINATVKENIVMEREFDAERYEKVITLCQLRTDVEILPRKDATEIGSRGINLSGGQRQRIALARGLYRGGDIFLLDDPLCQLDPQVARAIFHDVITGFLRGKTRVFVCSNLAWAREVPRVILVDESKIAGDGTYAELHEKNARFGRLELDPDAKTATRATAAGKADGRGAAEKLGEKAQLDVEACEDSDQTIAWGEIVKMMLTHSKVIYLVLLFVCLILQIIFGALHDRWLFMWCMNTFDASPAFYLTTYMLLLVGRVSFSLLKHHARKLFDMQLLSSLHESALKKVLGAPMWWHDAIPSGRLIRKLTHDFDGVFLVVYHTMSICTNFVEVILDMQYIVWHMPEFFLVVLGAGIYLWNINHFQRPLINGALGADDYSRDKFTSRVQELLDGMLVVRSSGTKAVDWVRRKIFCEFDKGVLSWSVCEVIMWWFNARRKLIAQMVYMYVITLCMAQKDVLAPAIAAVVLKQCLGAVQILDYVCAEFSSFDIHLRLSSRLLRFISSIPSEPNQTAAANSDWPKEARVEVRELCLRHRPELPLVLKKVHLAIGPGEKLGIVGRTGCGKSSFLLTINRIIESENAKNGLATGIVIGGEDIAGLGTEQLRQKVVMVPQEPWLFSGTVRENIDPFGNRNDGEILGILDRLRLTDVLRQKQKSEDSDKRSVLEIAVAENGGNLSQGERQLICLARAFAKRPKVLLLDEATANLDEVTDRNLQEYIRSELRECTVLMVAHRLNSLAMCDRVVALRDGERFEPVDVGRISADPSDKPSFTA